MNNIIRFWNQNRKSIIIGIFAIIFIIVIIQILNQIAKQQNMKESKNTNTTKIEENLPTESIIGDGTISQETTKSNVEIIEDFVNKCNNSDIVGAYKLLTDECKEVLFPTQENFKKGYYDIIFTNERLVDIEAFISNNGRYTYRVQLYDDILTSGKTEDVKSYQDYITIDENSNNGKININGFIYKKDINKQTEKDGIKLTILSQHIYKEHEDYKIKITNNTEKRISIDSREKSRSIYIVGSNNSTYSSNIYEIASNLYEIPAHFNRDYSIKFNKIYNSSIKTTSINFSDIIPDYEKYKQMPKETEERVKISVTI